jgi:hypothetical protein
MISRKGFHVLLDDTARFFDPRRLRRRLIFGRWRFG